MNEKQIELLKKIIVEEEIGCDFNDYVCNWIDDEDLKSKEICELTEWFEELNDSEDITDKDIMYYSTAMKILSEDDPSLSLSTSIAAEQGIPTEDINSELLASLLASKECLEEYNDFIETVVKRFKNEMSQ